LCSARAVSDAPQLVIAGSAIAQAMLGERWPKSDIDNDMFCTWAAAPQVRKKLIKTCGMICAGRSESYGNGPGYSQVCSQGHWIQQTINATSYSSSPPPCIQGDDFLDHVEQYAPLGSGENAYYSAGEFDDECYQEALKNGAKAVAPRKSRRGKRIGLPGGSAGGKFPYDWK